MPLGVKENPSIQAVQIKHPNCYRTVVYFIQKLCTLEKKGTQHQGYTAPTHSRRFILRTEMALCRRGFGHADKWGLVKVSHLSALSGACIFYVLTQEREVLLRCRNKQANEISKTSTRLALYTQCLSFCCDVSSDFWDLGKYCQDT